MNTKKTNLYYVIEAILYGNVILKGSIAELAEYFNDHSTNIRRANREKSLYKNKYNIVKVGDEYIGFTKAQEYAVADIYNNDFIEYIGLADDIIKKYGVNRKLFFSYTSTGNIFNDRYTIFKIED